MSLLSTPGTTHWSVHSGRPSYTSPSSSSSLFRSKPPRSSTLTTPSYFGSSSSLDLHRRSKMYISRSDDIRERNNPVRLTSYRDLSESRTPLSTRSSTTDSLTRGINRLSVGDFSSLYDSNGNFRRGHERTPSGSSQISGEALAPSPSPTGSDSGMGSRSITPSSSYHYRTLGSSNSSVDSIELGVRPLARHRLRRVSSISGDSSSGISVSSRDSSRSLGSGRMNHDDTNGNCRDTVQGLRNLGNSCFMNSILQCLVHTKLVEPFKNLSFRDDINRNSLTRGELAQAFANFVASMWSTKSIGNALSPTELRSHLQKLAPRFVSGGQEDAQEFLRYLLQGLHEDVNRVRIPPRGTALPEIADSLSDSKKAYESWRRYSCIDDSLVVDLFVGQLKSTLECSDCYYHSVTFDSFWDLSLPITDSLCTATSIQQCFDFFTKEEVLDGNEKPMCGKCGKRQRMTKKLSIWKCPKILVLHLKRFGNSHHYRKKLDTNVQFPLRSLSLSKFISADPGTQMCKYNLVGVSNHYGSTTGGHYTASCLNPVNKQWFNCDDSSVTKIDKSDVVSSAAYVLFYELDTDSGTFSRL